MLFDEVQCGMGRTGNVFAFKTFGVEPDVKLEMTSTDLNRMRDTFIEYARKRINGVL